MQVIVWPDRAHGLAVLLGLSFGWIHMTSPDLTIAHEELRGDSAKAQQPALNSQTDVMRKTRGARGEG